MSIRDEIQHRVNEERLIEFEPYPPMSRYRLVLLDPTINDQITGPWPKGSDDEIEMPQVRAALENFICNGFVTATRHRYPDAALRRLADAAKTVWEMRITIPKPGNRLLGFFAAQDVYVGTHLLKRESVDFDSDIRAAKAAWRRLFTTYPPLVAENIHGYISENVVELHKR